MTLSTWTVEVPNNSTANLVEVRAERLQMIAGGLQFFTNGVLRVAFSPVGWLTVTPNGKDD